jgi:Flp pilus assembly protein TadG
MRATRTGRRRRAWLELAGHDRGNAPLELVMLAPVIVFLIGLVIAAGRVSVANGAVAAAARDAARQASIAPNRTAAGQAAVSTADAALRGDGIDCDPVVTTPGLDAAFGSQIGTSALVTAKVTCDVRLSDLVVPGLPGSIGLTSTFSSPLDPYRSRDLP